MYRFARVTGTGAITELLRAHEAGQRDALDRVVPLVYDELRRLARRHLRRGPAGYTLDTTGLVHEAYLKLAASEGLALKDRGHLLAVTARVMRQVLVDRARARLRGKRGSGQAALELDEARLPSDGSSPERLLDVDRALVRLRERDPQLARIFECRFFGGFGEEETADALGLSLRTAQRGWMRARAWLRAELEPARKAPPDA
ncbi:MAG TPA: ECF-type sigma factor [Vicinamibacteria bacterium]|jgi:RNA polymerase sigma factor (TIGR02999 family)